MFEGNCLISKAGFTESGRINVLLKAENGAFDWTWFLAPPSLQNEHLAIALVAITSGKMVFAKLDNPQIETDQLRYFGLVG